MPAVEEISFPCTISNIDAVDLGLSVKWASCNVGATSPEEYGESFAWGETKSIYINPNCVTYDLDYSELKSRGIIDSKGNLTPAYDAATVNWGDKWRMPSLDEIKELINECTWKWTSVNGVNGRLVTGPNGNSIFLPADGSYGYYWSATPYTRDFYAHRLYFGGGGGWDLDYGYDDDYPDRRLGQVVRPVSDK